mgnify:CR=1 FL=1
MPGERHVALPALEDVPAGRAHEPRREPAPVLEQERPLAARDTRAGVLDGHEVVYIAEGDVWDEFLQLALRVANLLVGNPPGAAAL